MSLLRVECASCRSALQVRAEHAGQQVRCPKCGTTIVIPAAGEASSTDIPPMAPPAAPPVAAAGKSAGESSVLGASSSGIVGSSSSSVIGSSSSRIVQAPKPMDSARAAALPIAQASAPDMLAEIRRRQKSAVMVVFETPTTGSYELSKRPEANVRCYRTADMTDGQLMEVLEQVGHMSKGQRNQKGGIGLQGDGQPLPYELKGDRLGMSLEEFKTKYARRIGGMNMPYCSDATPGQANPAVWSEAWHAAARLVTGRIDLPSESNSPTVAGVKTELFLYHFVDEQLYRMTALFDTEAFHLIREALAQKQGPPAREIKEPLELTWENGASTIKLVRGTMRPKKHSSLIYVHNELAKSVEGRAPRRTADL